MNDPGRVNARDGRWIYGIHAVERRLCNAPTSVRTVFLGKGSSPRQRRIAELAGRHRIALRRSDDADLRRFTGSDAHQGVAALVTPFEYAALGVLSESGRSLLVLDQMNDPQNLGALLRTAVAAGFAGVVMPERGAVGITAAVEKAAAGAVSDLAVCRVVNLARALDEIAAAGYWRLALTPRGAPSVFEVRIPTPVALVLGGETGIRRLVLEHCDLSATIPQVGPVESLNASVAGAVAMYEILRRSGAASGG